MSEHEELRLYAEENSSSKHKWTCLKTLSKPPSKRLFLEFSGAGNVLLWGLLGLQYEVIQEENDANQSRRFELDSKQRERSTLQSTIEAFESICESCGQEVPDAEAHLSKKKQELADLDAAIQTLESEGGTDPRVLRQKLTAMEKHFMPNAWFKRANCTCLRSLQRPIVTEFEKSLRSVEQVLRNSSPMTVRKKFKH